MDTLHIRSAPAICCVIFALGATASVDAQQYTLTDLGTLGGNNSHGTGINISGQIVGYLTLPAGATGQAFLYSSSTGMQSLGTLGGTYSQAWGINSNGEVTGSAATSDVAWAAFTYSNGAMTNIGAFATGLGINASGQVTGYMTPGGTGYTHAFLYSSSTGMVDLGTFGGLSSNGNGINDSGQVVGAYFPVGGLGERAFLYSSAGMVDLGALGGTVSAALAINNNGQITGAAYTAGNATQHAFIYSKGMMTDLGTLGGYAAEGLGINASGEVVGDSITAGGAWHAFLDANGEMLDLNALDSGPLATYVTLTRAAAINDDGWIVADAVDSRTGQTHAYLLTPTVASLLTALLAEVTGVGPGTSLADKVNLAQTYYSANDIPNACSQLTAFVNEVNAQNGKKIAPQLDAKLITDAQAIETAIGCQ